MRDTRNISPVELKRTYRGADAASSVLMAVLMAVQLFYMLTYTVTQMATPLINVLPKTLLP